MATIYCTACGTEMHDQAPACPQCGAPNPNVNTAARQTDQRLVGVPLVIGILLMPIVFSWFLLREGHSTLSRVLSFSWLGLVMLMAIHQTNTTLVGELSSAHLTANADRWETDTATDSWETEPAPAKASPAATTELPTYTAQQLGQAYQDDAVAANRQFKGKRFKISGTVDQISADTSDAIYVALHSGGSMVLVSLCRFDDVHQDYVARLKLGANVSLICTGGGSLASMPINRSCTPSE